VSLTLSLSLSLSLALRFASAGTTKRSSRCCGSQRGRKSGSNSRLQTRCFRSSSQGSQWRSSKEGLSPPLSGHCVSLRMGPRRDRGTGERKRTPKKSVKKGGGASIAGLDCCQGCEPRRIARRDCCQVSLSHLALLQRTFLLPLRMRRRRRTPQAAAKPATHSDGPPARSRQSGRDPRIDRRSGGSRSVELPPNSTRLSEIPSCVLAEVANQPTNHIAPYRRSASTRHVLLGGREAGKIHPKRTTDFTRDVVHLRVRPFSYDFDTLHDQDPFRGQGGCVSRLSCVTLQR
jgi:hypothetical protein